MRTLEKNDINCEGSGFPEREDLQRSVFHTGRFGRPGCNVSMAKIRKDTGPRKAARAGGLIEKLFFADSRKSRIFAEAILRIR